MTDFSSDDFKEILDIIKNSTNDFIDFDEVKSIESNLDSKAVKFKSKYNIGREGTVVIGEDKSLIAVDINLEDGEIISFILGDREDKEGIKSINEWFEQNYKRQV